MKELDRLPPLEMIDTTIRMEAIDPADDRWMNFIDSNPNTNIFHHPLWIGLIADCYDYEAFILCTINREGQISSGVPIISVQGKVSRNRWISLPFTDHCAPLYDSSESLHDLGIVITQIYQQREIPMIELRWAFTNPAAFKFDSRYTLHKIELSQDIDAVLARIHKMHARNVRIAEKKDVKVIFGRGLQDLRDFYQLHLSTRRRQGIPIQPWRFFERLGRLHESGFGFTMRAYKEQTCIAAAVFLHWKDTLIYKYGASNQDYLDLRPNNLLFATAIRWGCENNYKVLDLGRTSRENTGLREFKGRWGARELPLAYSFLSTKAPSQLSNPLVNLARLLIRNSPSLICRIAGELFYRELA